MVKNNEVDVVELLATYRVVRTKLIPYVGISGVLVLSILESMPARIGQECHQPFYKSINEIATELSLDWHTVKSAILRLVTVGLIRAFSRGKCSAWGFQILYLETKEKKPNLVKNLLLPHLRESLVKKLRRA